MQLEFWARKICYWLFLWEYVSSTMSGNRNRTLLTIINCHLLYYLAQITSNKYLLKLYYIIHWKPRGWDKYLIFSHSIPILLPPLLLSHHVSTLPPSYVLSWVDWDPLILILSSSFNLNYRNFCFQPWQITSTKLGPLHNNYETGQNRWGTGQWAVQDCDLW